MFTSSYQKEKHAVIELLFGLTCSVLLYGYIICFF